MTNLTEYGKGCLPSAGVTYEPGGELAEELEHKIAKLKELLKECRENIASIDYDSPVLDREQSILLKKINQVLGEE